MRTRQPVDPGPFHALLEGLLGPEKQDYLDVVATAERNTFRFNPLKHSCPFQEALLARQGFQWEAVAAAPRARVLTHRPFPSGQALAHVLGHIYLQDLASMVPVWVLGPRPGERVLDLCASPGSKTTQIAAQMENRGLLLANDVSTRRLKVLIANLQRCGVCNTGVRKGFGEQCGNLFHETFDRVLLDPPCSALGTVGKSPEVLAWWSPERSRRLAVVQKNLILSALKALKPGGVLVYSTCTITPEENEEVVLSALERFPVELEPVEIGGIVTRPGLTGRVGTTYSEQLRRAVRLYPFESGGEGFFVARLRKLESFGEGRGEREPADWTFNRASETPVADNLVRLQERFEIEFPWEEYAWRQAQELWLTTPDWFELRPDADLQAVGLPLAHCYKDQARLTTEGCHLLSGRLGSATVELASWDGLQSYLNRIDTPPVSGERGQVVATFDSHAIGHALQTDDALLSRFPRTGWDFPLELLPPSHSPPVEQR